MKTWPSVPVPSLPEAGERPSVHDDTMLAQRPLPAPWSDTATLYSCGITPYDATHIGHAFTYLTADTLRRVWLDAGLTVRTAMNSTDVDDPLLERAARDGVDWRALADEQQELFRTDMHALRILPPESWTAVTERVEQIADAVLRLVGAGAAYHVEEDIYFDSAVADRLGHDSQTDRELMLALSRERGGDPDRPGKRNPLDPLLWRAERPGEPAWDSALGRGRPGWHIECTVIATESLGESFTATLGGIDLKFPHQEFQAQHAHALGMPFSDARLCVGEVAYQGEKMSKSLGNLVKVSELLDAGADPAAIRLALLNHHWRSNWEWFDSTLRDAKARLATWRAWAQRAEAPNGFTDGDSILAWLRLALADDLNTPAALQVVDRAVGSLEPDTLALDAIDALLGIRLAAD